MRPTPTRTGRCLCGLKVALHFHFDGKAERKLSCEQTRAAHPRAKAKNNTFRRMLFASGASLGRTVVTGLRSSHGPVIGAILPGRA